MLDLSVLNPPQREAVIHTDGPTLVLAGAGSGKTRVLTYKIAYLAAEGIKPWRILAVTFTNKAAREMSSRAEALLGIPTRDLWIGTFHGICVRILRREAEAWGFTRDFSIYDDDDRMSLLRQVLKELGVANDKITPGRMKQVIGKAKNDGIGPAGLKDIMGGNDTELMSNIYRRYDERLRKAGAFDFDDLLAVPTACFAAHPESLARWQAKFDHLLVDEYQDTNRTQYRLLKLIAGEHTGVTVVGDDDQSIYKWRGADIRNILEFERDYTKVKTVRLEQNYRSTGTIIAAANSVVANNRGRMPKKLWTSRPAGDRIRLLECMDDRDEAEKVVRELQERRDKGLSLRDAVILYRTNSQSRSFEDVLRRRAIPYTIVGGIRFYERREIKDLLAWLRLLVNPADEVSFARAAAAPRRGIGDRSVESALTFARGRNITPVAALEHATEYVAGAAAKRLTDFHAILRDATEKRTGPINEMAALIVERTGYAQFLSESEPETAEDRLDNVNELLTAMAEYENTTEEDTLAAFLAEVALVSDVDNWEDGQEVVTLMTLHAAKGLEFPLVCIAGVERGLFPLPQTLGNPEEIEEERRLFYVGITRAKDTLVISYAHQRMRYGSYSGGPSDFIRELPPDALETTGQERRQASLFDHREAASHHARGFRVERTLEFEDYPQTAPDDSHGSPFGVGTWVRHPTFGRGRITAVSGAGEKAVLTIRFGAQEKKIVAKFGNLTPA